MGEPATDPTPSPKTYTRIVLSGGETKGIAQLGALQHFWEEKAITHESVTHYAGASIGALLALLLSCGYTPLDIWKETCAIDTLAAQVRTNPVTSILKGIGLMPIRGIAAIEKATALVERRFGKIPTMAEHHALTGKTLVISVSNHTRNRVEYCSHVLTPDLLCMDAVMESCSVPGIFQRIRRGGCTYVDGAILDNFPLAQVDDGASRVLGITTGASGDRDDDDIIRYLLSVVTLPIAAQTRRAVCGAGANCDVFELGVQAIGPFEFLANYGRRRDLFVEGYALAKEIKEVRFVTVAGAVLPLPPAAGPSAFETPPSAPQTPLPQAPSAPHVPPPLLPPHVPPAPDIHALCF